METKARARLIVAGRVQGVFFRAETRSMALSQGLSGWVRNLSDGSVEAVFEGERSHVELAIEWCSHGPAGAKVDRVNINWEETLGEQGFQVCHR
jgi:acylphosphatase